VGRQVVNRDGDLLGESKRDEDKQADAKTEKEAG
jgi:hypothetical protein